MSKKYIFHTCAALLLVLSYFWNSGSQALMADEPTRALVSLEIMLRGNPIPTINNEIYLNKPPLYNWMLIPFYKVFGFGDGVTRFPAILSLLILGYMVFYYFKKFTGDITTSFFVAMALLTSGNMLFYSSLLGHIDATFSIFMFILFMQCYKLGSAGEWNKLYRWSYILCAIGFMLKGIPSIVFVGISLLVTALFFRKFKTLFSSSHFLNMLWFMVPVGLYFLLFSSYYPLSDYFLNLWSESSKRTVMEKSFLESFSHLFTFPVHFIVDTAPWSLLVFIFIKKEARQYVQKNEFLRFCVYIFFANIFVYWLAPDNRARYVMMLYPLFFALLFFTFKGLDFWQITWSNITIKALPILFSIVLVAAFFLQIDVLQNYKLEWALLFILSVALVYYSIRKKNTFFPLLFLLILVRIGFDMIIIPERVLELNVGKEKQEAMDIVEIVGSEPLAMYSSNLHHGSSFYITEKRRQILPIKTKYDSCDVNSYYLAPSEFVIDSANTEIYYSFNRKYQNKSFSLLKFKKEFPIRE
ncbi:glycosyltransferase family 39 protein [Bacteroidia bacterium]|nr:glycosyltransferase family 39 protein [Bacteroidia bacterium]MDB9882960.1 glycosyltransferase family 39 protein [Bacteroidia bacterium]